MFTSRIKKPLSKRLSQILWPSMGLRRSARYWRHRVMRLKDSDYKIAAGLAFGAAISFTPIPGAHILGALALCLIFRANLVAGALGTLVGNPWTLPLLWWFAYRVGKYTFIHLGYHVRRMPGHLEWRQIIHEVTHDPTRLVVPWLLGGFMLMVISWPVFYFAFRWILRHLRSTHHLWKETRLRKGARVMTEPK